MIVYRIVKRGVALSALVLLATMPLAMAQQIRGTPGTPSAVVTPQGLQLPPPTQPFGGLIMPNAMDSEPAWPAQTMPPERAPNVLLILTDDVGFGAPSTFGGVIPTPTLDGVAQAGLRYTTFHNTALCSPTRAALLTGRNHHEVGTGNIGELSTGYPGYNSIIPRETATIATILQQNGYATAWFGKNHNTPAWEASAAGPFNNWPVGMGFDYFFGFLGGDTSQWQPGNLFRNTTPIHPFAGNPGFNLTTAMADDAITYIRTQTEIAPARPWFIHYAPGGTHAPHQPTREWVERIEALNLFNDGWERLRERIFANQQRLGVIPANAQLAPWPDFLQRWESLSEGEKRLFIRQANVYAAYLAYTDHQIGRVIAEVERQGQLDNTLIIYISGDNGSSAEGSLNGTPNEVMYFNGVSLTAEQQMPWFDAWGSDQTYAHMAVGWSWAFSTPNRWTKQIASHFGGTRNGMALSWPRGIAERGGVRHQFHHVIDVVPTILEAAGVAAPQSVNGITQRPISGVSMAYTFPQTGANAPSRRRTQYFEILGNHGIYHEGWFAGTTPPAPPWDAMAPRPIDVMNGLHWELYNLADDPTQFRDISAQNPERLRMMREIFTMEATRNQVFPLDMTALTRMIEPRPGPAAGRRQFVFTGPSCCTQANAAPNMLNRSYRITADIEVPAGGGNGVLLTQGGRFGGWSFYLREGRPVFTLNLLGMERVKWEATAVLPPGRNSVVFDFALSPEGQVPFGHGGTGTLTVNGRQAAQRAIPRSVPFTYAWDETFDVGRDTGTSVDDHEYQLPFDFTGQIARITVDLGESTVTPAAVRAFAEAMAARAAAAQAASSTPIPASTPAPPRR